jgi:hypothetical protein
MRIRDARRGLWALPEADEFRLGSGGIGRAEAPRRAGQWLCRGGRYRAICLLMCNLYAVTKGQQAIRELTRAMHDRTGNLPPLPGIFPDYQAPIVRSTVDGRELTMARWGKCACGTLRRPDCRGPVLLRPGCGDETVRNLGVNDSRTKPRHVLRVVVIALGQCDEVTGTRAPRPARSRGRPATSSRRSRPPRPFHPGPRSPVLSLCTPRFWTVSVSPSRHNKTVWAGVPQKSAQNALSRVGVPDNGHDGNHHLSGPSGW